MSDDVAYVMTTKPYVAGYATQGDWSRRAVATPEEAREVCVQASPEEMLPRVALDLAQQIAAVSHAGGTITLPDGTVIQVKPVRWYDMPTYAAHLTHEEILDAFNAQGRVAS